MTTHMDRGAELLEIYTHTHTPETLSRFTHDAPHLPPILIYNSIYIMNCDHADYTGDYMRVF